MGYLFLKNNKRKEPIRISWRYILVTGNQYEKICAEIGFYVLALNRIKNIIILSIGNMKQWEILDCMI